MVNGLLSDISFQQIGGRCKIVYKDDIVSCLRGDIVVSERFQALKKKRFEKEEQEAKQHAQQRLQRDRERVINYLKQKKFETMDVNAEALSGFFCFRSYPLLEAAREKDWSMICLLLYFGADPSDVI
eukprot:g6270.t1